jgi:hypothetical protein
MIKIAILTLLTLCSCVLNCAEFKPVIQSSDTNITVDSVIKFDAPIIQCDVSYQGKFKIIGKITVLSSPVTLTMWTRVEGKYYFTRLPAFAATKNTEGIVFELPFDSGEKKADLVIITAAMDNGGKFVVSDLTHSSN